MRCLADLGSKFRLFWSSRSRSECFACDLGLFGSLLEALNYVFLAWFLTLVAWSVLGARLGFKLSALGCSLWWARLWLLVFAFVGGASGSLLLVFALGCCFSAFGYLRWALGFLLLAFRLASLYLRLVCSYSRSRRMFSIAGNLLYESLQR